MAANHRYSLTLYKTKDNWTISHRERKNNNKFIAKTNSTLNYI